MSVHTLSTIDPPSGLKIFFRGPLLDQGPLPALIYFALSGEESLMLAPYNQPAEDLSLAPIRVFSFSLPFHGPGYDAKHAMEAWAHAFHTHPQFLQEFLLNAHENVLHLIKNGWIDPEKIAVGGLSRGGLIAGHLAAMEPRIKIVLGYAPLTSFKFLSESIKDSEIASLSLNSIIDNLLDKSLRFYIGNRDTRVDTDACYQFIRKLTERCYEKEHRIAKVELIITQSAGFKGHGTLPPTFRDGADWIKTQLGLH